MSMSTLKAWTRDEIARRFLLAAQGFTLGNITGGELPLGFRDQVRLERHMHLSRVYIQQ